MSGSFWSQHSSQRVGSQVSILGLYQIGRLEKQQPLKKSTHKKLTPIKHQTEKFQIRFETSKITRRFLGMDPNFHN